MKNCQSKNPTRARILTKAKTKFQSPHCVTNKEHIERTGELNVLLSCNYDVFFAELN